MVSVVTVESPCDSGVNGNSGEVCDSGESGLRSVVLRCRSVRCVVLSGIFSRIRTLCVPSMLGVGLHSISY